MSDFEKIRLTREQLAKFLPNHETIKEFERLFLQDTELGGIADTIISASGLNADGTYSPDLLAVYISTALSLKDADSLLDAAIDGTTRKPIISTAADISLLAGNTAVFVDASAGAVNVTMPSPSLSLKNGASYLVSVSKIDSSRYPVNILPNGSEKVANSDKVDLLFDGEVANFATDGTNWYLEA